MEYTLDLLTPEFERRFWRKVEKLGNESGCWLWVGYTQNNGYGQFFPQKGIRWAAHRLAALLAGYPLQPKDFVCHVCDTPSCVRPDHLFVGNAQINIWDRES